MNSVKKERDKWRGFGNKFLTEGLFLEHHNDVDAVLYTTSTSDKRYKGRFIPSLHKLYVELEDVSEWNFANLYFANYEHWLLVKAKPFFKEYYAAMVEELNAKLRGKAIKQMLDQLAAGEASQATLKYLADNDYIPKASVGRPKKKKQEDKAKLSIISNDLARIQK